MQTTVYTDEQLAEMTIYEKLLIARRRFSQKDIKKSGYNQYSNYYYFTLDDIKNAAEPECEAVKCITLVNFSDTIATMKFINCLCPDEYITIETPMSTAKLKAAHDVQNLGAVQTYLRRYLYLAMFDITEPDELDIGKGQENSKQSAMPQYPKQTAPEPKLSRANTKAIDAAIADVSAVTGRSESEIKKVIEANIKKELSDVADTDCQNIMNVLNWLKTRPGKTA